MESPIFRCRACGEGAVSGSPVISLADAVLRMLCHNFQLQDLQSGDTFTANDVKNLYLHNVFLQMNTLFSLTGIFISTPCLLLLSKVFNLVFIRKKNLFFLLPCNQFTQLIKLRKDNYK